MKNYRVTVNGIPYDVSVEETSGPAAFAAPMPAPAPSPAPLIAPVPAAAPAATAPPAQAQAPAPAQSGSEGSYKLTSPMPGVVLDIKVKVSDQVTKNQVVVILESMKMENEIVVTQAGKVASVNVTKGATVQAGELLITID